jgi:hypothetical protein
VIKATKSCHKEPPYDTLAEGDRIVVRCELEALIEEKNATEEKISSNDVFNENIDEDDDRPKTKYRCRGEGLPGRNTRFSALAVPSCRGKWLRLTVNKPKKCSHNDSQFIFV